jgi:hypothetical protein
MVLENTWDLHRWDCHLIDHPVTSNGSRGVKLGPLLGNGIGNTDAPGVALKASLDFSSDQHWEMHWWDPAAERSALHRLAYADGASGD